MIKIPGCSRFYTKIVKILYKFNHIGRNVIIYPSADISRSAAPYIYIDDNVNICDDVWLNIPFERRSSCSESTIIRIGKGSTLGRRSTISGIKKIVIGKDCLLAPNVFLSDHSHEFLDRSIPIKNQGVTEGGTIIIEDGVWFGINSCVVTHRGKNITIGKNSVIGANSVINRSFPANSIIIGMPAKNVAYFSKPSM